MERQTDTISLEKRAVNGELMSPATVERTSLRKVADIFARF